MARRVLALAACLLLAIAGGVRAQDADFATLEDAAKAANLTILLSVASNSVLSSALISPDFQGIVLAPTDAAFAKLNESLPLSSLSPEEIDGVLSYHVIAAGEDFPYIDNITRTVNSTLLSGAGFPSANVTTNITFVPFSLDNETVVYAGGVAPGAVTSWSKSVTAAKARVYIIDEVLLPPSTALPGNFSLTVADVAIGNEDFTLLAGAVAADPEVLSVLSDPDSAYTVFAPTNEAFLAFLEAANITLDQAPSLAGTPLVNKILKTHVLDFIPLLAADLAAGNYTVPTLSGEDVEVVVTVDGEDKVVTVQGLGNAEPVTVTAADIKAGKSVIHVVDGVILPAPEAAAPPA